MLDFKIHGLDDLQKDLKRLKHNARSIGQRRSIDLDHLLSKQFLKRHTKFSSLDQLFDESPFDVETQEDFDALNDQELDDFIRKSTSFPSWQDMLDKAADEWAEAELFRGVKNS